MAVGMNRLTTGAGGSGTTGSFTPTANALVLAFVVADDFASGPNIALGNGNGLTWVNLFDANIYLINTFNSCGLFYAMATSPSSGGISISGTCPMQWDIIEFTGVSTSGSNGSGAIIQSTQTAVGAPGSTATFGSATDSANAIVAFIGAHDGTVVVGVSGGYTTIDTGATSANRYLSAWLNGSSQSSVSFTEDAGAGRAFALEVGGTGSPAPTTGSPTGLAIGAGF